MIIHSRGINMFTLIVQAGNTAMPTLTKIIAQLPTRVKTGT